MKIKIRKLKALISEALQQKDGAYWGTREELDHSISAMDPDTIADADYLDIDTGEVYLDKGQQARMSSLHPKHAEDHAAYRKIQQDLDDAEYEAEMAQLDAEDDRIGGIKDEKIEDDFDRAMYQFVLSFAQDYGPSDDPEGIAMDAAEPFFSTYPEWHSYANLNKMNRRDIKEMIASYIVEAMNGTLQVPSYLGI